MSEELQKGTTISHYEILSSIGKGGMGEVFLAEDTKLNRKVALKILPKEFAADIDRMNRFVREAKSASALNHPNIITIYEIGESEGTHFIATEFIDGKTLTDYAKANRHDDKTILEIAVQVASALQTAHVAGIVHRDIKPDNIMIRADGLAKILDFGIAKLSAPTSTDAEAATALQSQTQAGMIIGTANYMSPEQAAGKAVDARSDIFSFGVILYEMISGKLPFAGETAMEMIGAILHKEPQPLGVDVPAEIKEIIGKCLRKDRSERYQTIKAVCDDLKRLQMRLIIEAEIERTTSPNRAEAQTQILQAQTNAETESQNSIAVLPFANMSADEENEYFCDGLAEELLNALSKIEDLKVAARTSAFSFKGKNANASEIGERLNVKTVLEGSVRRSGNRLRISVQLVNAADGFHLWSERYDREMQDIFDVQDEITLAVVDALKVKLFGEEKAAVLKRHTRNAEAHEHYLRGLFYFNRFTPSDFPKAIEYFNLAIAVDTRYAAAFAGLANAYVEMAFFTFSAPGEWMPKAQEAAGTALSLDDTLGEAHNSLAIIKMYHDLDYTGAEREFKRALALDAGNAHITMWYAWYLGLMGRFGESFQAYRRALELDPLSEMINTSVGIVSYWAGQFERGITQLQKVLELNPNYSLAQSFLAEAYAQRGDFAAAEAMAADLRQIADDPLTLPTIGYVYGKIGDRQAAQEILTALEQRATREYVSALNFAQVYAGLGDTEQTLTWLEKACRERPFWITFVKVDPKFDFLRSNLRFIEMLNRIGFPPEKPLQTDESLEAPTVMLKPANAESKQPEKTAEDDLEARAAEVELNSEPTTNPKSKIKNLKSLWMFGLLALLVIVGGFFGYKYLSPTTKQIESIAVMPFVNESGNADVEYLSDGMTETLISSLSNLPNLNVKPRSTVFRYKGKETNPQTIAKELNVQAILNGRAAQRGNDISLYVELIDISLDKVIWSETYNRKQSDLVALQSDIARDVSSKLKSKLSGAEIAKVEKIYTTNPEAYQLYLKGRYHYAKLSKDDIFKGIEYFQKAIELDPNFAMAYVGIANSYNAIPSFNYLSPKESIPQAKTAAQKALEIDPTLAEAHTALAASVVEYDWDWEKAEREFKRALELNPNAANAHFLHGIIYLVPVGRTAEAITEIKRAAELEPLNVDISANLAAAYMYDRQFERALEQAQKNYDFEPNFVGGRIWLATMYNINGKHSEAIALCEKSLSNDPTNPPFLTLAGYAYAKNGQRQEAEQIIKRWQEVAKTQYVSHYWIAVVYAALDKRDEAFTELEKAYQERDYFMPRLKVDPFMDSLRDDPRFKDLLRRLNLPE
jgi:eukaryotic-like serine/threonine-protein kinase